jgi:long-chain acyl-CoA synthetase
MVQVKRLFDIPYYQLETYPKETMFVTKSQGTWSGTTTSYFLNEVMLFSRGLISLGIKQGDNIALVTDNRVEWNIMDFAIQQIGAIVVPLYPNISEADYAYILNNAEIKLCIVGNEDLFKKIAQVRSSVPTLIHLFSFDHVTGCTHWSAIRNESNKIDSSIVESRMDNIKATDLATIIYTSGTTGHPKGVMLTHENILSNVFGCRESIPADEHSRVLTFLPVCHIYERMLHYLYMYLGCSIYFAESLDAIGSNAKEVQPHVFSAVPRLIEKVFDKIIAKGEELNGRKKKIFFWSVSIAEQYDLSKRSLSYNLKLAVARTLVFSKWKKALGGNIKTIASGSAALQPRLIRIFYAAGIPILEGYGLTETSPVISVNCFKKGVRIGTVGPLLENVTVKIADDGEILVKGPNVMKGYYKMPQETAEAIDKDGWFHTGDIGIIEDDIFLKITDRKKEIFKTSGGKYVVPQAIENKFKESRFIEQLIVVGEGEKFPSALIVPNFEYFREWSTQKRIKLIDSTAKSIINNPHVKAKIQEEIYRLNKHFGSWEQIKKFVLLENEFSIHGGELTPTLKLKRKIILKKYTDEYESIYRDMR